VLLSRVRSGRRSTRPRAAGLSEAATSYARIFVAAIGSAIDHGMRVPLVDVHGPK